MNNSVTTGLGFAAICLTFASPLSAVAAEQPAAKTPIMLRFNFTDIGGVRSWRTGGDSVIFIKNKSDQWYKAELADACMKLDTKKGINFITETDPATNAKTSAVVVDRHICKVTSLTKVAAETVPAQQ